MMDKKQIEVAKKIFNEIVENHKSMRELGRLVDADASDISLWRHGRKPIRPKVVITLCRLYDIAPQLLRPDVFDEDVILNFKRKPK